MALALAACGGGSDAEAIDFVASTGILDLELPTDADRASLPTDLDNAITEIQDLNENGTAANPTGDLFYSGVFGLGLDDDEDNLITGTVAADFELASNEMDITLTVTDDTISDANVTGSISDTNMAVSGGLFTGDLAGTLTVADTSGPGSETFAATADLRGATVDFEIFGDFDGQVENTTASSPDFGEITTFGGLFYAED